ncbi:hypothetical protein COY93_02670 [Candidatus Uhrbacteria bacterium CG_4_10_14_0_8_um_filter_58_22]|uniref:Thioredoxin domain-containing protein n=1 Tax=Candidatus Uhrbacteria bacterium CG_4_10_14_0_8_um_filter_58_22 TaxID=1975029 RepID=A0A2M7QAU3_9BACT|nr:MAG: hypothetical protein AUJ19_00105 [Parcubacteria group bacterium CG1_02_58_44]PIY62580.1 MAG: hypothetical protein COY93_02670 [Candidatus Uhrbacteria bacterium CG_4_10_14_0_8_um_filter_58_22]
MAHDGNTIISPKVSFTLGLVGGVLVLCTIGFFILLSFVIGSRSDLGMVNSDQNTALDGTIPTPIDNGPSDEVGEIKPIDDTDHVVGPDNAEATVYIYTDFECPYCGRFHPSIKQLMDEYEGRIKVVFRHFPLSFHANARPAANAAECAAEQGKFWEFADGLFEDQTILGTDRYENLARSLKLNMSKFDDCVSSAKFDGKISDDLASGVTAGVQGTPGTIIVGADGQPTFVPGAIPYDQLKAMLEATL